MFRKRTDVTRLVEAYGEHPLQMGEWFVPAGGGPAPTVVLIHGGFWGKDYERHLEDHVARDLAAHGYLCWNIDYRPADDGWPWTLTDVAAAYDHLMRGALGARVDPTRVAVVGHSAGGHLAAWLGSRHRLAPDAPGYNPDALKPTLIIPQAGVVALTLAADTKVGRGAPQQLIGGSVANQPERFAIADPFGLLPTGIRSVLIHSPRDKLVPLQQSRVYVERATELGDDSRLEISKGDHFSHLDPKSQAWQLVRDALAALSSSDPDQLQ
jgi:acetyl esterase/lipase